MSYMSSLQTHAQSNTSSIPTTLLYIALVVGMLVLVLAALQLVFVALERAVEYKVRLLDSARGGSDASGEHFVAMEGGGRVDTAPGRSPGGFPGDGRDEPKLLIPVHTQQISY